MTDETKRMIMGDILARVGADGVGNVILEQNNTINVGAERPVQMPPELLPERCMEIYRFLRREGFIAAATPSEHFLYLMGAEASVPDKLKPVEWMKTQQLLRTMLTEAFAEALDSGAIRLADIERRAADCFLVKGRRIDRLAKPKPEISGDMDALQDFFRLKYSCM